MTKEEKNRKRREARAAKTAAAAAAMKTVTTSGYSEEKQNAIDQEAAADQARRDANPTVMLLQQAVCLAVNLSAFGNSRKVSSSDVATDADKTMIAVQKTLLASQELQAIVRLDGQIYEWVYSRTLPSVFRRGYYLTPLSLVNTVVERLREFKKQREELVEKLIAVYPAMVKIAEERLRSLFDPKQYPSTGVVRNSFRMTWNFVNFGVPETLDEALFEEEKVKAQDSWREATEEVRQVLCEGMAGLVNHMVNRLTPSADGKPKIFRDSMVGGFREFLDLFAARNIIDDSNLAGLAAKARSLLDPDVDVKTVAGTLRQDGDIRKGVLAGFGQIKVTLDTMIGSRTRAISFDDEQ